MNRQAGLNWWPQPVCWHDVTLTTPAENLALDEVLLQQVDADPSNGILRTWEPTNHFVVLGRSNQVEAELNEQECRRQGIPIYRRASGGGAVVVGPGCLAYALILPLNPELRASGVVTATQAVMEVIASSLCPVVPGVTVCGTSDLVVNNRKFSGNSQRWLKNAFLHHGTILYDYELPRIEHLLKLPARQPEYRLHRPHADFVANLPIQHDDLVRCLVTAWNGQPSQCDAQMLAQSRQLAASKYDCPHWNYDR